MFTKATRFLSLLALSTVMLGCGDSVNNPATTEVTGTVTYKGKPVEGAIVKLWPLEAGKKGASGRTDASGNYKLMTMEQCLENIRSRS